MPSLLILLLCLLTSLSTADDNGWGSFSSPHQEIAGFGYATNMVWALDSIQSVQWSTNMTNYNVTLWQQNLLQPVAKQASDNIWTQNAQGQNIEQWRVTVGDLDLDQSPVFFFWVNHTGTSAPGRPDGMVSYAFNITRAFSTSSSTLVLPSTSLLPAGSAALFSSPPTSTPPLASKDGAMTATTKVGLGVSLGIGVPVVILLAAIVIFLFRSRRPVLSPSLLYSPAAEFKQPELAMPYHSTTRYEVPSGGPGWATSSPVELDTAPRREG